MSNNFYDVLWVDKNATSEDIKKAYRKKAMEYHQTRNSWDKKAEEKFKEINSAYDTLWDESKKKTIWYVWSSWNSFGWWNQLFLVLDFDDLKIYFLVCDDQIEEVQVLNLILKIYFEIRDEIQRKSSHEKNKNKKKLLILKKHMKFLYLI